MQQAKVFFPATISLGKKDVQEMMTDIFKATVCRKIWLKIRPDSRGREEGKKNALEYNRMLLSRCEVLRLCHGFTS